MIEHDTVFILGAGASVPYGYPDGKGLRKYICTEFNNYFLQVSNRIKLSGSRAEWEAKATRFSKAFNDSSTASIDLFLARNQHFSDIGRIAIMLSIFDYERKSKFREDCKKPEQDWYKDIFHSMTKTLIDPDSYKNFGKNKVTFITFNYDRSLEHFLYESLRNSFSEAPEEEIIAEIKKTPIHHVFGKVQELPWEDTNNPEAIDYMTVRGDSPYTEFAIGRLKKWSSNIKLIHDREEPDAQHLVKLGLAIKKAKRIYFLGFGYAKENLELFGMPNNLTNENNIYGTAMDLSKKEIKDVRYRLNRFFGPQYRNDHTSNPNIQDMDCVNLLRDYL